MKKTQLSIAMLVVLGATGIVGCSDSDSNGSVAISPPSKSIRGMITGFGSVFVNGVEYETSGAGMKMDGTAVSENDLQVGMVVNVQGTVNPDGVTGVASSITYADEIEGVVLGVNLTNGNGTLNIMGQTVQVGSLTVFNSDVPGITLTSIPLGCIAEVSGYTDGNGTVYATRIEIKQAAMQAGDILEVKGVVNNLNATTFQLGELVVDYSSAALVPANLANGLYVEVKGDTAPVNAGGTYTFTAASVERAGDGDIGISGSEGDDLQMQGVVMAVDAVASTIVIDGQMMKVRSDAMRNGLTLADLTPGTYIKLEAEYTGGQWQVKEIEVGRSSDVEVKSAIEAVNSSAGTITLMGKVITIDNSTLMLDESTANPQHYFDINDLQAGDRVEVDVFIAGEQWIAAKLMREDPGAGAVLEGKVTSVTPVKVAGLDVAGLDALGITPEIGMSLEINGTWDGATLTATSAVVH